MVVMVAKVLLYSSIMGLLSAQLETQNQEEEGRKCVEIDKCPSMYSLFNSQPLTALTMEFLERSECEFDESHQLLCCVEPTTHVSDTPTADEHSSGSFDLKTHPKASLLPLESCGLDKRRIWGGSNTKLDEFPWLALLYFEDESDEDDYDCGGVLISKRYVLTVAQCLISNLEFLKVRLGEHNIGPDPDCETDAFSGRRQCAPPIQEFGVEDAIVYPKYDRLRHCHNIALIRLDRDVKLDTKYVKPICLPMDDVKMGQKLVLAGWTEDKVTWDLIKVKTEMPVVSLEQCDVEDVERWCGSQYLLCTDGVDGKGSSTGDSGMPLMQWTNSINDKRRCSVAGLVSYTFIIRRFEPTIYTNVFKYLPWILESIQP